MIVDPCALAEKAFTHLSPRNPLHKLGKNDRVDIWALLKFYSSVRDKGASKTQTSVFEPIERLSKLVSEMAKLGAKLESELTQGTQAEILSPLVRGFEDLPGRLTAFAGILKPAADCVGKRGHLHEIFSNRYLIEASELVRLKTGQYFDEHLAELYQAVAPEMDESSSKDESEQSLSKDLSGDAIRKTRIYTAKHYPELYDHALNSAKRLHADGGRR